ncbi:hypothetical protein LAZ67_1001559 [Cordylochernes scorpioides]|uniref:Uncharacterized protein n=1 Tax=Cordylochernes scorpioides TaxID=51811 RepID=A0ABY6JYU0_9ARAC|nr:hypothetical protein LAZ67_1001559 [Cordylochernes scorpioides]
MALMFSHVFRPTPWDILLTCGTGHDNHGGKKWATAFSQSYFIGHGRIVATLMLFWWKLIRVYNNPVVSVILRKSF